MNDFFSDFLDRAERMLLDMPPPKKNTYVRPPYQPVFYNASSDEKKEEDSEGMSTEGRDSSSMEGLSAAVTLNNAGTYKPMVREAAKAVKVVAKPQIAPVAPAPRPLSFSRDAIVNGILMAEILGKLLALRGRR